MKKASFTTGLIAGAILGTAVGMIMDPNKERHGNRAFKSASHGFFRTMGGILDSVVSGEK